MKLIENWKQAPAMWVVQILAVIALLQGVWAELPPEVVAEFHPRFVHYMTLGLAVLGIVARLVKQFYSPDEPAQPKEPSK